MEDVAIKVVKGTEVRDTYHETDGRIVSTYTYPGESVPCLVDIQWEDGSWTDDVHVFDLLDDSGRYELTD